MVVPIMSFWVWAYAWMEMLKGGGVGAKRVMMATQGEGLGSGFCSSFFWSFEKEKKGGRRRKRGRRR
jgi:hypothetical protein